MVEWLLHSSWFIHPSPHIFTFCLCVLSRLRIYCLSKFQVLLLLLYKYCCCCTSIVLLHSFINYSHHTIHSPYNWKMCSFNGITHYPHLPTFASHYSTLTFMAQILQSEITGAKCKCVCNVPRDDLICHIRLDHFLGIPALYDSNCFSTVSPTECQTMQFPQSNRK